MSGPDEEGTGEDPERLYIVTGGRSHPDEQTGLDVVTLIVTRAAPKLGMQPEHATILRMCEYPLSVAEISAYLELPISAVRVLLEDLLENGRVEARAPIPASSLPDVELLEAVMHGLQKL